MFTRLFRIAIGAGFVTLSLSPILYSEVTPLNDLKWTTIRTPHFNIHYHQGLEPLADHAAKICEPVYNRLTKKLGFRPPGQTELVLTDAATDSVNGLAIPVPYRIVILYLNLPEDASDLDYFDDTLTLMLTHEYTHIVNIGAVRGIWKYLQYVFGAILIPNSAFPQWVTEGIAAFNETDETSVGRGRAPEIDMAIRADSLEDRFIRIDDANYYKREYPKGSAAYWYGLKFHQYLVERFGFEKLKYFYWKNSGTLYPFFLNFKTRKIFGKSFFRLWDEWKQEERVKALNFETKIESEGRVEGIRLTDAQGLNMSLNWAADSKAVLVGHASEKAGRGTFEIKLPDKMNSDLTPIELKKINPVYSETLTEPDADGNVFYSKSGFTTYPYEHDINDLYRFNPKSEDVEQLTHLARVFDPAIHPNYPNRIFAVQKSQGFYYRLVIFDLSKKQWTTVLDPKEMAHLAKPTLSPNGELLAFTMHRIRYGRNLYLLNLKTNELTAVTQDYAPENHPTFSPDGRYLLYVCDKNGTNNIYAYDLENKTHHQVTNTVTGILRPKVSPDGKWLAFFRYYSKGYDLHLLAFDPKSWKPTTHTVQTEPRTPPIWNTKVTPEQQGPYKKEPYSALNSKLLPHYILPIWYFTESTGGIGAATGSFDPLAKHIWAASGVYDFSYNSYLAFGGYTYSGIHPAITLTGYSFPRDFGLYLPVQPNGEYPTRVVDGNTFYTLATHWERAHGGALSAGPIHLPLSRSVAFSLQLGYENRSSMKETGSYLQTKSPNYYKGNEFPAPPAGHFPYAGFSFAYGKISQPGYPSIDSPSEIPLSIGLTGEFYFKTLASEVTQQILNSQVRFHLPIPLLKRHRLSSKLAGGIAFGDNTPQRAFIMGGNVGDFMLVNTNSRQYYLRGFSAGMFRGNGALECIAEYRFPLLFLDWGPGTFPIYLRKVHWAFFSDLGQTFDYHNEKHPGIQIGPGNTLAPTKTFDLKKFNWAIGAELRLDVNPMYFPYVLQGRFGYARRVLHLGDNVLNNNLGRGEFYLLIGTSF